MKKLFVRFAKNESGVTAIEYGLIATLVGVAIIAGATVLGQQLGTTFTTISGHPGRRLVADLLPRRAASAARRKTAPRTIER